MNPFSVRQLLVAGVRPGELTLPPGRLPAGLAVIERIRRFVRVDRPRRGRHRVRLRRDPLGIRQVRGGRDVLVLAATEERRERRQEARGVAERSVVVELEVVEVLAQEDHDLRARQDPDVRREAELQGVLADDRVAEGVEGRDVRVRVAVRHELVDADRHLVRGLVRERQGEDLRRLGPGASRSARRCAG